MLFRNLESDHIAFWCPGCDEPHVIGVGPNGWTWDAASLTVSPSIKVSGVQWERTSNFHKPNHDVEPRSPTCCHSFIRNGVWEFLGDSTHALTGQSTPLVDWTSHY